MRAKRALLSIFKSFFEKIWISRQKQAQNYLIIVVLFHLIWSLENEQRILQWKLNFLGSFRATKGDSHWEGANHMCTSKIEYFNV